jgi:oligo-1,6-glucosidase
MQWNDTAQAGFTSTTPWLAVNENYRTLNVEVQESNPDSVLNYFRNMIQLRKKNMTLVYGAFELVDEDNQQIFAYTRQLENEKFLVVLNFSDQNAALNTSIEINENNILISNYKQPHHNNVYQPYASVIYKLGH